MDLSSHTDTWSKKKKVKSELNCRWVNECWLSPLQRWCCQVCGGTVCWGHSGSVGRASGWTRSWKLHSPQSWSQNGGCPAGSELWPQLAWPPDQPPGSDTGWGRSCWLCSETHTGGEHRDKETMKTHVAFIFSSACEMIYPHLFDMAESPLRTVCVWDDPPPSFQWTLVILSSTHTPPLPPLDAPPPPGWESIRRTEGDPHLWLLDHIQVLTRNSDDSASTAEERHKVSYYCRLRLEKHYTTVIQHGDTGDWLTLI